MEIGYYSFAVAGYAIPSEPSGTFTATRVHSNWITQNLDVTVKRLTFG
jgi:hypothetical protein